MLVRSLLFYVAVNLEAFIFCFAGEYLSIKVGKPPLRLYHAPSALCVSNFCSDFQSKMIGDAAYESLWYDLTPSENRILLFLIMRSQKQLTITIGRFTNLSLQQFANVSFIGVRLRVRDSVHYIYMYVCSRTFTLANYLCRRSLNRRRRTSPCFTRCNKQPSILTHR